MNVYPVLDGVQFRKLTLMSCLIPEAAIVRAQQELVPDDDVLPDPGGRPKGQNQKNLNPTKQRTFCSSDPERSPETLKGIVLRLLISDLLKIVF